MRIRINLFNLKLIPYVMAVVLAGVLSSPVSANPYAGVDWENYGQHTANFHTHTTASDGRLTPQDVTDRYRDLGYSVLSITDRHRVTYPWTEFSKIPPSVLSRDRLAANALQSPVLTHEDRDPAELGMVAVEGAKASRHHRMGTYFCSVPGMGSEEETLAEVREEGGIAVFFHPGQYAWSEEDYIALFRNWDELIGMEVYNQGDRYSNDRALWDDILTALMPERPVWGFSNDDMHTISQLGRNRTVLLLKELTAEEVRNALVAGRFYFSRVLAVEDEAPVIESVRVRDGEITIEASGYNKIIWISDGNEIHEGETIHLETAEGIGGYVRARLTADRGWTYTQPFSTGRKVPAAIGMEIASADEVLVFAENYMEQTEIPARITLAIDGENVEARDVTIEPWGKICASFALPFLMTGKHSISAVVDLKIPAELSLGEKTAKPVFNRLKLEKEFDFAEFEKVPFADLEITADGDLSEWENVPAISIGQADGISADIRLARDEDNIYISAEVVDEGHFNTREGISIWNGDCLQFSFAGAAGEEPFNLGLALASGRLQSYQWMGPETGLFEKSVYNVVRDDVNDKTFYEIKIPLESLKIKAEKGAIFRFNAVVFDDMDGAGYDYWIEITPGIAGGFDPGLFRGFILWD